VAISYARTPWWSKDINANLLQWVKEIKVIRDYGQKYPENFLEIRYEDLVLNPEQELTMILKLFGATYEKNMVDPEKLINYTVFFKQNAAKHQSGSKLEWEINKKEVFFRESVYAWKKYGGFDFRSVSTSINETLGEFGYQTDEGK
jgi:hypothetical protein